jgi:hypothetical protein
LITRADDAGMMTEQLGFSILTAPIAAIDRRALSQAWYSALHLAQTAHVAPGAFLKPQVSASGSECAARSVESRNRTRLLVHDVRSVTHAPARKSQIMPPVERRAERSTLARRIERAFLNPFARPQRATFTVDGTRARVHVALQTTAAGVRIVAVCPASIRSRVSRALDEARFALATRGIVLHADVSEV